MSRNSDIEWTDDTWNLTRGCRRTIAKGAKQSGCGDPSGGGCYAERTASRFCGPGQPYDGLVRLTATGYRWTGKVAFVAERLADPLRWQKPRRIFVDSMSDLFYESLTNEQIAAVFGVMAACPQHTFQILTKRAKRMREWFAWMMHGDDGSLNTPEDIAYEIDDIAMDALAGHFDACHLGLTGRGMQWPLPNVWLGVSVENQEAADERIPELLATPAAVRFLSCEPLLGDINARLIGCFHEGAGTPERPDELEDHSQCAARIGLVIAGCESGPKSRPTETASFRSLRDQCNDAGVPFFLKQARLGDGITMGPMSKRKPGGVISAPLLDGVRHDALP